MIKEAYKAGQQAAFKKVAPLHSISQFMQAHPKGTLAALALSAPVLYGAMQHAHASHALDLMASERGPYAPKWLAENLVAKYGPSNAHWDIDLYNSPEAPYMADIFNRTSATTIYTHPFESPAVTAHEIGHAKQNVDLNFNNYGRLSPLQIEEDAWNRAHKMRVPIDPKLESAALSSYKWSFPNLLHKLEQFLP